MARGRTCAIGCIVDDHADALILGRVEGQVGESYNIGGWNERRNIDVVQAICSSWMSLRPIRRSARVRSSSPMWPIGRVMTSAMRLMPRKIERDLGWRPAETFETGLRKTVAWYLENRAWWERVRSGVYRGERLGIAV